MDLKKELQWCLGNLHGTISAYCDRILRTRSWQEMQNICARIDEEFFGEPETTTDAEQAVLEIYDHFISRPRCTTAAKELTQLTVLLRVYEMFESNIASKLTNKGGSR